VSKPPDMSWVREVMAKLEHDLRNPLTAVMGFADLLGMSELNEPQREHLNRIHQAAEQLLQVLETMEERAMAPQRTVVYLEDDPGNVGLIGGILVHRPGVRLLAATDAASGLDMVRKEMPDLVLLDLGLPDRNGTEVLADLRPTRRRQTYRSWSSARRPTSARPCSPRVRRPTSASRSRSWSSWR
jgi:signal transduction histidine kinase